MTASSFTSVSLDPPLILVCVYHRAAVLKHLRTSDHLAVNVLREEQRELSEHFARRGEDRFNRIPWEAGHHGGVPLIPGALATFECGRHSMVDAGDHTIVIAEVLRLECHEGRPLVYFGSGYHRLDGTVK